MIVDSDSEKENEPDSSKTPETFVENSETVETAEIKIEKGKCMKCLYGMKQKATIVAYTKMYSVTAATTHFDIPRTTIGRWMVDGYFKREVKKRGVQKGAGRPLTYSTEIDEQLLVWVLENRDLHLPITIPLLQAKALRPRLY